MKRERGKRASETGRREPDASEGAATQVVNACGMEGEDFCLLRIDFQASAMILLQGTRTTMKKQRSKLLPRDQLRKKTCILLRSNISSKFCVPSPLFLSVFNLPEIS